MLAGQRDERRVLRLALDIMWQASRHKRATSEREYLLHDLAIIEEKADELVALLNEDR